MALEENLVINFTDVDVPLYSIGVLSYGPGWIPCPEFNQLQFRLDGYNAGNKQAWKAAFKDTENDNNVPNCLLKKSVTSTCDIFSDPAIAQAKQKLTTFVDNLEPKRPTNNMNRYEREGLNWLKTAVHDGRIAITSADKGGAILILTPTIIRTLTEEKLKDDNRYKHIGTKDPTPEFSKELQDQWKIAINEGYVDSKQAKKTMGMIYKQNQTGPATMSTMDVYKPGIPYGYPLPKVHKLNSQQLTEKVIPPCRFVTDLSNGVTARADKFVVWRWLGQLAKDYATDLVKDSTEALIKLEDLGASDIVNNSMFSFSIDVVSLYDSLNHKLVFRALEDAMQTCRPDWDEKFRVWLKDQLDLSFRSAVVKYDNDWYAGINGIPTGGIPSVDAGNISVYYVLKRLVYLNDVKPEELLMFLRFVDDGSGIWNGTRDVFLNWFQELRRTSVAIYGLDFTFSLNPVDQYTQFLDIQYKFVNGKLTTDLYKKETDANRYLNYSSCHPRHMFKSIVYSQALRCRRIINDEHLFLNRLLELRSYFLKSSYPEHIVDEQIEKVKTIPRTLVYKEKKMSDQDFVPWVVTYGAGFEEAKKEVNGVNEILANSSTWSQGEKTPERPLHMRVISRRSPNVKDLLYKRRSIALSPNLPVSSASSSSSYYNANVRTTVPCTSPGKRKRGRPCQSCKLMSNVPVIKNNSQTATSTGGNCKSKCLIYAAQCKICDKNNTYIGKTVQEFHCRINGHRSSYYEIVRGYNKHKENFSVVSDDTNVLGAHLFAKHGKNKNEDFNSNFTFTILKFVSPSTIRINEQSYIESLNTLYPFGLNNVNSIFG